MSFYIERFIPKLVPVKDTMRVRRRVTPSFDTPVVTDLGEGARQKILIHQVFNSSVKFWARYDGLFHRYSGQGDAKKIERIRINLSHLGLVPGLCQLFSKTNRHCFAADIADDNRETLRNTRYSANQSQKTVLTEDYLDSYTDIN